MYGMRDNDILCLFRKKYRNALYQLLLHLCSLRERFMYLCGKQEQIFVNWPVKRGISACLESDNPVDYWLSTKYHNHMLLCHLIGGSSLVLFRKGNLFFLPLLSSPCIPALCTVLYKSQAIQRVAVQLSSMSVHQRPLVLLSHPSFTKMRILLLCHQSTSSIPLLAVFLWVQLTRWNLHPGNDV